MHKLRLGWTRRLGTGNEPRARTEIGNLRKPIRAKQKFTFNLSISSNYESLISDYELIIRLLVLNWG